eukprot:4754334-Pyramimonas_sp.AAC.1
MCEVSFRCASDGAPFRSMVPVQDNTWHDDDLEAMEVEGSKELSRKVCEEIIKRAISQGVYTKEGGVAIRDE